MTADVNGFLNSRSEFSLQFLRNVLPGFDV
jgi:hypothetical protein